MKQGLIIALVMEEGEGGIKEESRRFYVTGGSLWDLGTYRKYPMKIPLWTLGGGGGVGDSVKTQREGEGPSFFIPGARLFVGGDKTKDMLLHNAGHCLSLELKPT